MDEGQTAPAGARGEAGDWRQKAGFLLVALAVLAFDQWTKWLVEAHLPYLASVQVIPRLLNFTHVRNPGVAFGLFASGHGGAVHTLAPSRSAARWRSASCWSTSGARRRATSCCWWRWRSSSAAPSATSPTASPAGPSPTSLTYTLAPPIATRSQSPTRH